MKRHISSSQAWEEEEFTDSNHLQPAAIACIQGNTFTPGLKGIVSFYSVPGGTEVCAEVIGLPAYQPAKNGKDPIGPHGFHIHETGICQENPSVAPFHSAGGHWNPGNQPHGNHAGDFPVLFSNDGYACLCFFTNKFRVHEVIGKTVIIHENPDDYRTQPAGNAGRRLACGVIEWVHADS